MLIRQQSARHEREEDPEEVLLGVLLVGRELVIRPCGLANIWPALFADAKLNNELRRQGFREDLEMAGNLLDNMSRPGAWDTMGHRRKWEF